MYIETKDLKKSYGEGGRVMPRFLKASISG